MAAKATTTRTVEEILRNLHNLQIIDSKVDEIQILKGELPMEVSDLEDEVTGLEKRIEKLNGDIGELDDVIGKYNASQKESETLIERYEKQLDEVKNNREFDALTKEIELQKLEIQLAEKKAKEVEVSKTNKNAVRDEAKEKLDAKTTDLDSKKVELDKIIEKTDKEEAKLAKKSKSAQNQIEERLLQAYHRIRKQYRNGLAVVTVKRNACGGCFNRIPPQMQIEIANRKNIIACEHCGRVLIDDALAAESGKKAK